MAQTNTIPLVAHRSEYGLWDRLCILRDQLIANPRFQNFVSKVPFLRSIAKQRANQLFDVMAGFVYSQILLACVRLNLFEILKDGPLDLDTLKNQCGLDVVPLKKLLDGAASIHLLELRSNQQYGLGKLGAQIGRAHV